MFGKIRDKLKNVFEKSEDLIEENPDKEEDVLIEDLPEKGKKGFLGKLFGKKDEEEQEVEENQEELEETFEIKEEPIVKKEKSKIEKPKKKEASKKEDKVKEVKDSKPKKEKVIIEKEIKEDLEELPKEEIKEEVIEQKEELLELEKEPEKKSFLGRIFSKKKEEIQEEVEESEQEFETELSELPQDIKEEKEEDESFLSKTFTKLKSKKITDDDFERIWVELEIFLLEINIAFEIAQKIEEKLREELIDNSFNRFKLTEKIKEVLAKEVEVVLKEREANFLDRLKEIKEKDGLIKIIILGVNGTGKTTTIAKIVKYLQDQSLSVVVAAADTFRAAAIEQLEEHSKNLNFKLIRHKGGSDPAAVAFDAIEHAKSKNLDVVLIDTAGRMPNNSNLLVELQKIKRISTAQLTIFIGDSISGNDLIEQIELFDKGIEIDGVILTKVDTDERPGSIVTTAYSIEKPIYFLGAGQTYDDLVIFDAKKISKQLFEEDE